MAGLHFDATYNNADVMRKVRECQKAFTELGNTAEIQGKRIDAAFEKISLKSLERMMEIMKNFPKEIQGISSFQKQISEVEKHIERVNQRIASVGSGKLGSTFSEASNNINIGNVLKEQVYVGAQAVNTLSEKIIQQKILIKDIEGDIRALGESYKRAGEGTTKGNALFADFKSARTALQEEKNALFELQTQQAQVRLSVRKLKDEQSLYQKETQKVVESNENMSVSFKKALGVIGGVAALKQLGSEIIKVRGEFQSMQTAIETLVGKDMADNLIPQIKELAKISPLTLSDMINAEKMMLGFNIKAEDTIRYLQALGDISMGDSQKFNSLTLAFSQMSAMGRLLGGDLNQMINAGFNPLQTISENTGKSIAILKNEMSQGALSAEMVQQAFIDATSAGGKFYQMSENASKTINGQLSILQDALDEVFNEIGTKGEGAIMSGIQATTSLIQNYETVGKILAGLVATFGVYKAATVAYYAITNTYGIYDVTTKELQFAATMKNIVATKALTVQQALLNKTMLSNPYILIATLVVGAAAAMWAFHDSTTAAEKAQSKFNDELDKFKQKEEERKQKIESLIRTIQDETETEFAKVKAYEELQRLSPALTDAYKREELAVASLADTNKELNKVRDIESYDNIIANIKKYTEYVNRLSKPGDKMKNVGDMYSGMVSEYGVNTTFKDRLELAIEDLKQWQEALNEYKRLKKEAEENAKPVEVKLLEAQDNREQILQEFLSAEMTLKEEQRKIKDSGCGEIPIWVEIRFENAQKALSNINGIIKGLLNGQSNVTYKEAYDTAKREWKAAQKALEESKKKSKADYVAAKKDLDDKEKNYKDLGGVTNTTKQESAAKKLKKEQEKRNEELLTLQKNNQKSQIDLMEEGSKKKIAQIELDYKNEIAAIKKQEEEWSKAQGGKLTEKQSQEISIAYTQVEDKKDKGVSDVKEETQKEERERLEAAQSAWNEYYKEYGTWKEKRLALDKEYQQKINDIQNDKNKSNDEKKALMASSQKEWEESVANLNLDRLKQDINWEVVFGDMSKVAKQQLQEVKKQLQEFKKSPEFKNATPVQIKVIEEALNNINNALVDKSGFFGGLSDSLNDYKTKLEEAKKAQEEYDEALKTGNEALIEKATENRNTANANLTNSGTNVEKSKDKAVSNINAVSNAIVQLGRKNVSLTDIGNTVGALVDTLGKSGSMIGGIISAILSIIDAAGDVGTFQYGMNLIENVSSKVTDAFAKDTEAITGLDMSFMKSADYDDYNEMKEQYETINSIWDELIDKKTEYLEIGTTEERKRTEGEILDLIGKQEQAYRNLGLERLNAGSSAGSHSIGVRIKKGMSDEGWNQVKNALGEELYSQINDGRMEKLFSLSSEQLEKLKGNAPDFWAKLDDDVRKYLEDIIKCGEQTEETIKKAEELWAGMSFDSMVDQFKSALSDMDSSTEDFADDFQQYMINAMIDSFVKGEIFQKKLKDWYKKLAEYSESDKKITEEEKDSLKNDWDAMVQEGLDYRNNLFESMGFSNSSSTSQDSTKGSFESMSQDTGMELNGRFTALQISNEEIKNSMLAMLTGVNLISTTTAANGITLMEIRNVALMSNSHLEDIAGFQKKIVGILSTDLGEIKQKIKTM